MLLINNVTVRYDEFVALDNVTLHLESNKLHGLIGQNGAGKTTLLNTLYGFLVNENGEMTWNGQPLITTDMAYLPVDSYFYPYITGREYLELICMNNPDYDITSWNSMFNLPLKDFVDSYSSGMKKKLAVMGLLALKRPIIMMDEPFNNLDISTNHMLGTLLKKLVEQEKTVLLTSHVLESLTSICDQIHVIERGKIQKTFEKKDFVNIEPFLFKKRDAIIDENFNRLT